MRRNVLRSGVFALSLVLSASAPAYAQTWTNVGAIVTNGPGGPLFWNNPSDDRGAGNLPCNIGGILTRLNNTITADITNNRPSTMPATIGRCFFMVDLVY